jgi:hypothetical protein
MIEVVGIKKSNCLSAPARVLDLKPGAGIIPKMIVSEKMTFYDFVKFDIIIAGEKR